MDKNRLRRWNSFNSIHMYTRSRIGGAQRHNARHIQMAVRRWLSQRGSAIRIVAFTDFKFHRLEKPAANFKTIDALLLMGNGVAYLFSGIRQIRVGNIAIDKRIDTVSRDQRYVGVPASTLSTLVPRSATLTPSFSLNLSTFMSRVSGWRG